MDKIHTCTINKKNKLASDLKGQIYAYVADLLVLIAFLISIDPFFVQLRLSRSIPQLNDVRNATCTITKYFLKNASK